MMLKKLYALFFATICSFSANSQFLINEYSCSNVNTTLDAYNEYQDWIELYNPTGTNVNLTGYWLSDDPGNTLKWQVPAVGPNLNAGGYQMIYCSGRGTVNGAQIHPDFRLTQAKGEWIIISDPSGALVDSVKLRLTLRGHSRGRATNGAPSWSVFTTPTANASNNTATGFTAYATKPIFDLAPGVYTSAQVVNLSSPDPNVTIRYTTDGSVPTAASTAFTAPIAITTGAGPLATVIRARAFSTNANITPSFVETNTYITNETTTMNIISISGSMNNLFGSGAAQWVSYEFFDNNYNFIEEFEGFARRHGHDSWAYAQKGFKIYASDKTGYQEEYKHKYFRTSTRDKFDMLLFKAAGSDNYNGNNWSAPAHMRDAFCHTLAEKYNLKMDFRRYEPTIVYINGQYWGVYEIRERVDKDHIDYYYGKNENEIDYIKNWGGWQAAYGSTQGWTNLVQYITNNSMAVPANYQVVKDSLDIVSYCQYMIFNQYVVNSDWLNWNTSWWRARGSNPIKWRYSLWDNDNTFDLGQNYTGLGSTTFTNDPCDMTTLFQNPNQNSPNNAHAFIFNRLSNNPEFVATYQQQWLDMLAGPFECTNIQKHFDSIKAIITPEMPRQCIRWNTATGSTIAGWNAEIAHLQAQITGRCNFIAGALADTNCFGLNPQVLKLNVDPPNIGNITLNGDLKSPYVWSKLIQADSFYNLKANVTAGPYWTFDYWSKQNTLNSFVPNTTTDLVTFNFEDKDSVVAHFKYFNFDSLDVTFNVNPPGSGTISLNGNVIPAYPTTIKLDRRFQYDIVASPTASYKFLDWQKNNFTTTITPDQLTRLAKFNYDAVETITGNFEFIPPPPPLPELTGNEIGVFVPNAFSPNGDGKNDLLNVRVGKDVIGIDFSIVDRWGKTIFNTNRLTEGWDGKIKGRPADVGTYQYLLKVRFRNQTTQTYKGDVSLIR
jgi:gliding motility-associated-like protein